MSLFKVPEHIASVIFGGGCGVAHSGEGDCARCAPFAVDHIYPAAPAGDAPSVTDAPSTTAASAPETPQSEASSDSAPAKARPKSQPAE